MNRMKTTFVGVDVQGDVAVLATGSGHAGPTAITTVPANALGQKIDFSARVAVAMPPRESVCRWLETPFSSFRKARKVLPTLLDIQLPFPLDECVYVFVTERKSVQGKVGALAAAARHQTVASALATCEQRGINPALLDHEGLALWTQAASEIEEAGEEVARARVVIYAGVDRACVALGRGELFLNSHAFSLDQPAQLLRLLRAALGEQPGEISWIWSGPRVGAENFDALRQAVEDLAPGTSATVDEPHAFLARALCRRMTRQGAMPCNFRSGHFADIRRTERMASGLGRLSWALLLLGALLWASTVTNLRVLSAANESVGTSFAILYQRVTGTTPDGAKGEHAVTKARRALEEKSADLKRMHYLLEPSLTIALLDVIVAADAAALQIHECLISETEWRLTGLAKDRPACERLKAVVEKTGLRTVLTWGEVPESTHALPFVLVAGGGA